MRSVSFLGLLAVLTTALTGHAADGAVPHLPSAPVGSVFHIEKSENRNQVHYAVRVDDRCRPVGAQPVYAYWRDLEVGPSATSPLLEHEQAAYGLNPPRAVQRGEHGGEVRIGLRGFPDRPLLITTFREGSTCRARAFTTIGGKAAMLSAIYVELGLLVSIDYVIIRGVRVADGRAVKEKVDD